MSLRGLLRKITVATVMAMFVLMTFAQGRPISGVVKDQSGETMVGVNVFLKGTTIGTITDIDGKYSLTGASDKSVLVFSFIGYQSKEVTVGTQKTVDVAMESDLLSLEEVVVMGYGTVKRRDLTGAVSSVKSDVITLTPSTNPMEALQGRVAGLDITKSSGQAGSGVNMQLRGNRSISASGSPLFIIDGMPGDYSTLNPNDIESIEILKDASSTAVYGSSGSNGVIIITTKKGKEGSLSINLNAYVGFNGWSVLPKMNTGEEYYYTSMLAQKEAGTLGDSIDIVDESISNALLKGETVDWADALMQTATVQNYSLSVSGGTKKTQAYFSLNYSDENGQYTNDEYKLLSSTMRINHDVTNWVSAGMHSQISYVNQEKTSSKLSSALRTAPFGSLYKEDGSVNEYPILDNNKQVNLLLNQNRDVYRDHPTKLRLYIQPYLRITPLKGLTLESRLSLNYNQSTTNKYIGYGSYQFYDAAGTGAVNASKEETANYTSAAISNSNSHGLAWENILTYNFNIAQSHDFTITAVSTYSNSESESSSVSVDGITSNAYLWTNLGAATGANKSLSSGYSMGKSMGYVGRLNYSFLGRYMLSASIRRDGNSKLAEDCRWSTFPAVSAGWRISDENWMAGTSEFLDNLKLRVGYGETGAAGIDAYDSWSILGQSLKALGDETMTIYSYPAIISNPTLTWERSKNTNIGIDASFFNNRIDLTADYYITNTDGVIWEQTLPITSGGQSASSYFKTNVNLAETNNKGLELTLTTRNIMSKDFGWTSTFTFSNNKEEVTALGEGAADYITNGDYTLHIGSPIKSYYGYKIDGIWQYGEEADAAVFGKQPGDMKIDVPDMVRESEGVWVKSYEQEDGSIEQNTYDANNKYSVNANDKQILGHNSPDWSFGFQNTFTYKSFDLSIYMYMRHGQMMYYDVLNWYSSSGGAFPSYFDYWTSTNPSNDFPALNSSRNWTSDEYYTSRAYVDASFFKIKNITLGYTMPSRTCKKMHLQGLRLYGTITNPYVKAMSHLVKDYDPEMNGDLEFPLTKQLVFGLNISF